jgi:hypothetical protein
MYVGVPFCVLVLTAASHVYGLVRCQRMLVMSFSSGSPWRGTVSVSQCVGLGAG